MKAESFFIGPLDDDKAVELTLSLSDLKYIHGILVENYNKALNKSQPSTQLQELVVNIQSVITHTLESAENKA
jgi:uncharacterized pyridoxal phosphate-containing UPF0001 family protein